MWVRKQCDYVAVIQVKILCSLRDSFEKYILMHVDTETWASEFWDKKKKKKKGLHF